MAETMKNCKGKCPHCGSTDVHFIELDGKAITDDTIIKGVAVESYSCNSCNEKYEQKYEIIYLGSYYTE